MELGVIKIFTPNEEASKKLFETLDKAGAVPVFEYKTFDRNGEVKNLLWKAGEIEARLWAELPLIAELIHHAPGVVESALYHIEMTGQRNAAKTQTGFEKATCRITEFRLRLSNGSKVVDVTKPTLREAVCTAFADLKLTIPDALERSLP